MAGEDAGTRTLPVCGPGCVEASMGDFEDSALITMAPDSGDAGLVSFVLDCDGGAIASTLLGTVCGEIE